jgi:hypothetical protein
MHLRNLWQRAGALSITLLALLCVTPASSHAQLSAYGQDFESMVLADMGALSGNGWLVFGNVYSPAMAYLYGYGPFPAPNNPSTPAFCALDTGQGGVTQGANQLSVYSDYQNADHAVGNWIESNVFQERTVVGADVGSTWHFEFDAKIGNLGGASTALAFIKTLDPNLGFQLTNFKSLDMTSIPTTWTRYRVSIFIDGGLAGQILQFGFANLAKNYEPSGVFYDNVEFTQTPTVDVPSAIAAGPRLQMSTRGNPSAGGAAQVLAFNVPRESRVTLRVYDVTGGLVTTLLDRDVAAGAHQVAWLGRDDAGRTVPAGLYVAEVVAGADHAVTKLSRLR